MSFGEITITLDNVPTLVGIPVMGRSVSLPQRITDSGDVIEKVISVLATPTPSTVTYTCWSCMFNPLLRPREIHATN